MPRVSIFLIFTPIRGMIKYYEVVTIIHDAGKETSPQQILTDLIILLIGQLKSACYTKRNKSCSTIYMFTTTIHETSFRLVLNILRPQFSNDCNRCYFWHTETSWHKQKPNRKCFIIIHIQWGPQYSDVSYFRIICDYNPTPRLKILQVYFILYI
jgi:hypothetical protein